MLYYIQQKKEVKDMKKLLVIMIAMLTYIVGAYTTIKHRKYIAHQQDMRLLHMGMFGVMNNKYGKSFMNTS